MAATCVRESSMPEKMNTVPASTPQMAPTGLNACARLSRCSEVAVGPSCAINGFDAVSRKARPLATTNRAIRKKLYWPEFAAGRKRKQPLANKIRPVRRPAL